MSEPTLEGIEDYNNLAGEKKRVVWAVVLAGLVFGLIYIVASGIYTQDDIISQDKIFKKVPMK